MNAPAAVKAPGDLDTTFASDGVLTLPTGFRTLFVQLNDGKLLGAGKIGDQILLLRLHSDGSADESFGENGMKALYTLQEPEATVRAIERFADDSLLLQGTMEPNHDDKSFLLRTLPDGELDSSFGNNGHCVISLPGGMNSISAMKEQSDGKIVLIVTVGSFPAPDQEWLVRLVDGRLDLSFGADGTGTVHIGTNWGSSNLLVLPDDALFIATGLGEDLLLARFDSSGHPDPSFGQDGKLIHHFDDTTQLIIADLLLQADGKIVATGDVTLSGKGDHTLTLRLNPDGAFDPAFNDGAAKIVEFDGTTSQNFSVVVQSDGKIVTGGGTHGTADQANFVLMRFTSSGELDASFGDGGRVSTELGGFDILSKLFLRKDGKVLALGNTMKTLPNFIGAMACYLT